MEQEKQEKQEDNVVYIGGKPFMNYVTSVIMQFNKTGVKEITIKARGKFTSKAIDVSEVVTRKFLKERNIKTINVKTGSEEYTTKEDKKANVSIIEITLGVE